MILAMLLMAQEPGTDAAAIERRLASWRGRTAYGKAGAYCKVTRSTGDAAIDRIGCTALDACRPAYTARIDMLDHRGIRDRTRKTMETALARELDACVASKRGVLATELAASKAGS